MALVVDRLRNILSKAAEMPDYLDKCDVSMNGTIDNLEREHLIIAEKATCLKTKRLSQPRLSDL